MAEHEQNGKKGAIKRDIPKKKKRPTVKRDVPQKKNNTQDRLGPGMDIKDQTVARRRNAHVQKKIDPKRPEIQKGARRNQGYKIKNKKKGVNRAFLVYSTLFLIVFILIASLCALLFYANLVKTDNADYSSIKLKMGLQHEVEEIKAVSVDVEKYYRDGVMYVNMTKMADEFGFIMTGDHRELRFITDEDSGEEVRFELGSQFARVNGSGIRLPGSVYKEEGLVFVPAVFITEYMNGVEFAFDEEEKQITVLRNTARNEAGRFVESDISFRLKSDDASASLPEGELTEAQKEKCYFKSITMDEFNSQNQTAG